MRAGRLLFFAPLVGFALLAGVFAWRVTDGADRSAVPSALLGQSVPQTQFPALETVGFAPDDFEGQVTLVNVFASWCAPCRVEHPVLMALSQTEGLTLYGMNYKDRVPAAREFLAELGDPYDAVGVDPDGRRAIEWGVYGVPETFLVGPDGVIRAKHVGVLSEEVLAGEFGRILRELLVGSPDALAAT